MRQKRRLGRLQLLFWLVDQRHQVKTCRRALILRKMLKMKTMLMNVLMMETQMIMKSTMTNHLNRKKTDEEEEVKER